MTSYKIYIIEDFISGKWRIASTISNRACIYENKGPAKTAFKMLKKKPSSHATKHRCACQNLMQNKTY